MKAKAAAGIALVLRFSHIFGLLHGGLNTSNILFTTDYRIQLADFSRSVDVGSFLREAWTPRVKVSAFATILSEIVSGPSTTKLASIVPEFVSELIEHGLSPGSNEKRSFNDICLILLRNGFQILPGVDSEEVSAFVNWVESSEKSGS
jgi:hypothetical protein